VSKIVLSCINAKYVHSSFALKCLKANLKEFERETSIEDLVLKTPIAEAAGTILKHKPSLVGLGLYIWNHQKTIELADKLKKRDPHLVLVAGGPQLQKETVQNKDMEIFDHIILGEGEEEFYQLCLQRFEGSVPARILRASPMNLDTLKSPYGYYTESELKEKLCYVESSRGCPYGCEFCLSCLDTKMRYFDAETFLESFDRLILNGARRIKFLDRTFNTSTVRALPIVELALNRLKKGYQFSVHFEVVPKTIDKDLMQLLGQFPKGSLQLEIGLQSLDPEVLTRIGRNHDVVESLAVVKDLRQNTQATLHTDLIAGLPGEGIESFAEGFDRLLEIQPHEIQVGILKCLPGTPILRHKKEFGLEFASHPPYDVQSTANLSETEIKDLQLFASFWEIFYNRSQFVETLQLTPHNASVFWGFMRFSKWANKKVGRSYGIYYHDQISLLHEYLSQQTDSGALARALQKDYLRWEHRPIPREIKGLFTSTYIKASKKH
jgi:radical SAM superfamily enzyme YgiQ (UPF0313 family)